MGEEKEETFAFMGKRYVMDMAKLWFDVNITFNQVEEIRSIFNDERRAVGESKEDKFERVLMAWVELNAKPAEVIKVSDRNFNLVKVDLLGPIEIDNAINKSEGVLKCEILNAFMIRGKEVTGVDLKYIDSLEADHTKDLGNGI